VQQKRLTFARPELRVDARDGVRLGGCELRRHVRLGRRGERITRLFDFLDADQAQLLQALYRAACVRPFTLQLGHGGRPALAQRLVDGARLSLRQGSRRALQRASDLNQTADGAALGLAEALLGERLGLGARDGGQREAHDFSDGGHVVARQLAQEA
jgi:hypothetical protein